MEIKGVDYGFLTLHCGLGVYRDIEVEDLTKHKIDSEQMVIPEELCERVNPAYEEGHRICVVGASTMRAVETGVSTDGLLKPREGWTNKFISLLMSLLFLRHLFPIFSFLVPLY